MTFLNYSGIYPTTKIKGINCSSTVDAFENTVVLSNLIKQMKQRYKLPYASLGCCWGVEALHEHKGQLEVNWSSLQDFWRHHLPLEEAWCGKLQGGTVAHFLDGQPMKEIPGALAVSFSLREHHTTRKLAAKFQ